MPQASQINEDLLCSEAIDDPYAYFGRLRELDPVHWNPLWQGWIVTRYQDVVAVLHDAARFSSDRMAYLETHASADKRQALTTYLAMLSRWLVFIDPPDHARLRLLLQKASFTPPQLLAWRSRIQAIVDDLLAQIEPGKPVDFIQAFAFPLPVLVVSEILGFPPEDRNQVRHWTTDVALPFFLSLSMDARTMWARAERAAKEFSAYARALLQDRRQHPRDDLLTAMVQAEHKGDFLNEDEVVATTVLLMIAGHETTSNLLANGLLAFLHHPDQIDLLRHDPTLVGSAVEECLRYDPPVTATVRWSKEDVELDGQQIKGGQKLLLVLASANRDPAHFANPDRFDITRHVTPRQHTAFAVGTHYCLGAPLARQEGEVAFTTLFQRFQRFTLAIETPAYKPMVIARALESLPVVMA
jgi:cytochrome P450